MYVSVLKCRSRRSFVFAFTKYRGRCLFLSECVWVCDSGTYLTVIRQCTSTSTHEEEAAEAVVAAAAAYGRCIIVIDVRHF